MASYKPFTHAQRGILRMIADGYILRKYSGGYEWLTPKGDWHSKAYAAPIKSLAMADPPIIAKSTDRIYFTSRGYGRWYGGEPTGEKAALVKAADERVAYVKSMTDQDS